MFKITDHIKFDAKGRAPCPCCVATGKNSKNLSLIPNTDGAYKCHRGCTPDDIREALGTPKAEVIPPSRIAIAPKYHSEETIKTNTANLLGGKIAKKWLSDRGIDESAIALHKLGACKKLIEGKEYLAITIAYEFPDGYLQKYFIAPWLPSEQRPQRITQDKGLNARFWFTKQSDSKELWLCEGEWDAIALAKIANCDVATSTTGAGNIPTDLSPIENYDAIVIFYDLDEAGIKGADKLAAKIGDRAVIATVPNPPDHKSGWDVSDAILAGYKLDDFIQAIGAAPAKAIANKNPLRDRIATTQELLDRAPDFVEFLVHDLITANELQVLAAPPRAGKSLLALGLAHAVATGKEFMGRPVQQGCVIYVNVEDGDAKLKERINDQGWQSDCPVYWLTEFDLSEWNHLLEIAIELKPRLVVIDTLTSVRNDDGDENSSKIATLIKPLKEAAKHHNFAVLLVHHTKKLNANLLADMDVFETMRGSGTIRSECRGAIVLAEVTNKDTNRNEWRLIAENGSYQKQDLLILLDGMTKTWKTLSNWTPNCSDSQESQALAFFDKVGQATIQQLSANTSIPVRSAYTVVTRLVQREMLIKQGTRQNAYYMRPIQQIQQLNSLLNSPSSDGDSNRGHDSTKDKNTFFVVETAPEICIKSAHPAENIAPQVPPVELERQTYTQQVVEQFNKPKSVELQVGDRVEILTGQQAGKVAEILAIQGDEFEVKAKRWQVTRFYPAESLKLFVELNSSSHEANQPCSKP
jgi:transcription antitermination factor NusG